MMSLFLLHPDKVNPSPRRAASALTAALLTALAAIGLSGCKGSSDNAPGGSTTVTTTAPFSSANGAILIGEYGSLSGDTATFGTSTDNGIKLAIGKANSQGGALNRQLSVQVRDDRSDADATASTVESLISQNVVAVLGEVASTRSLRGAPVCQAKKIPMISPASTNPTVTQVGDYIFRVCFIDEFQGRAIAQIGSDILHAKRAVILFDNGQDYSTGLSAFIKKNFTAKGGQIVGELSYSKDTTNFSGQLTTIKQLNPDVIFIPGYYNQVGQIAR
ncbi:MAG: ABC transporter substrate-binding protein, partial [Chloroflexi bacterium]|nr:ABC transporter substrate-binding protein [Chloroflexota bacterium]